MPDFNAAQLGWIVVAVLFPAIVLLAKRIYDMPSSESHKRLWESHNLSKEALSNFRVEAAQNYVTKEALGIVEARVIQHIDMRFNMLDEKLKEGWRRSRAAEGAGD